LTAATPPGPLHSGSGRHDPCRPRQLAGPAAVRPP